MKDNRLAQDDNASSELVFGLLTGLWDFFLIPSPVVLSQNHAYI